MRTRLLFGTFFLSLFAISACNQNSTQAIAIEDAWIREAPPNASALAGYMRISNNTDEHIILHSAESTSFTGIEFHQSVEKNGVYRMIPQLHLHIAANSTFELKPGGYHLMLFNPANRLVQGDKVTLKFTFSEQQQIEAIIPVKKAQ